MDHRLERALRDRVVPVVVVGLLAVLVVLRGPDLVAVAGLAVAIAIAVVAIRNPEPKRILSGELLPLVAALGILSYSSGGAAGGVLEHEWRVVLAIAAYPFLGRAMLQLVRRHRQVRDADVLVEAALVAVAVGVVLHVATASRGVGVDGLFLGGAGAGFTTMLVALDAGLLVIGARSLTTRESRRGPLGLLHIGLALLTTAHLMQHLEGAHPRTPIALLAACAVLCIGGAAVHPAARREPTQLLRELQPFSTSHAIVVVAALLASPTVLVVLALRGVSSGATVTTGGVLSGLILASYLVQLLRERAAIEHDATHDGLTLLPNRTLLVDRLERSIAHARRNGRSVGVLFIDLDQFKEVNDTFGHAAGDALLRSVATRLQRCVRDEDTVARLAGDEFVVLLPHLSDPEEVVIVAERMLAALGEPFTIDDERLLVAGSVGISLYPHDGSTAEEILAGADAAMYSAKETTGSHWQVFSPSLAEAATSRMQLEAALLDGIARDELVLHYQPLVDAQSGLITGAEALVRWQHPERGLLPPNDFIPLAERSDLIVLLGDWVLRAACKELRHWQDLGLRNQSISVNVAARHFTSGVVETITAALRETGADPSRLIVELTESAVVDNLDAVAQALAELRQLGVRAAIDDFGTGYCGLRYLSVLPVASLKIDRSFIQGMTPSDAAIVGATIAMGRSLGLKITAEGVETPEQRRFLTDKGADVLQGYLLGRPMPAADMVDRMRAERSEMPQLQRIHPELAPMPSSVAFAAS